MDGYEVSQVQNLAIISETTPSFGNVETKFPLLIYSLKETIKIDVSLIKFIQFQNMTIGKRNSKKKNVVNDVQNLRVKGNCQMDFIPLSISSNVVFIYSSSIINDSKNNPPRDFVSLELGNP